MLHNKAIVIFALLCITFAIESSAWNWSNWKRCLFPRKCSDMEQVVWASDGRTCHPFRNQCYFEDENCDRQNRNMKGLKPEPKEECQKKCRNFCTLEYKPICGIYNDKKKTFSNFCDLFRHICRTGETYSLYSDNACDQELSAI